MIEETNAKNLGYELEENQFTDKLLKEVVGGERKYEDLRKMDTKPWVSACKDDKCAPEPKVLDWENEGKLAGPHNQGECTAHT